MKNKSKCQDSKRNKDIKRLKKIEPFFVLTRLVSMYTATGIFILSLILIINIRRIKGDVDISENTLLNYTQIMSTVLVVISLVFIIAALIETGTKTEDSKHISNMLNKSIIPIVTIIIIFTGNFITEPYSFFSSDNTFKTDAIAVYFQIVPIIITILYNLKVFWLEIIDEKKE